MREGENPMQMAEAELPTQVVRDVADFHLRWPEFRPCVIELLSKSTLTPTQRQSILWLVRLADRIGQRDLL